MAEDPICVDSNGSSISWSFHKISVTSTRRKNNNNKKRKENNDNETHLEIGEKPQIRADLVSCGAKRGQRRQRVDVDFSGVGLGRHRVCVRKPAQLCNTFV
jgi:hypothetical protein